ncbi:HAD-superfamily hydrolase, subfamily IA, variant 3 [Coriobacterium glomerans PW2]|uniref:HAD-superfamily hydrolase, subfamily IA, variant 3 n=1 Tax=Coriobacterium glomerans (strain ATCC 49209 / DSM 20642 / JCM 10262 / PW2) TaxID=700015 RepID=F2N7J0_CORGP|nr:HAD family phosphatase [Coriobacterium glomerans]AEB06806.1 HAD-superfamily hydrolase, subfamily IA, variant 3 [Coriobacterium glomerans PW2]
MLSKKTVFIFDLDGLLLDTECIYKRGWEIALQRLGLFLPDSVLNSWAGKSIDHTRAAFDDFFQDTSIYDRAYAIREEYILETLRKGRLMPKPYAPEALQKISEVGCRSGVVTSSQRKRAMIMLTALGLMHYFDHMVSAEDVSRRKPDPEPYHRIVSLFESDYRSCIAFEDSLTGYRSAAAAGVDVILVPDSSISQQLERRPSVRAARDLSVVMTMLGEPKNYKRGERQ